ncbi:MAG: hypothetical protein ACI4OM_03775, partial [Evtepia sp.]
MLPAWFAPHSKSGDSSLLQRTGQRPARLQAEKNFLPGTCPGKKLLHFISPSADGETLRDLENHKKARSYLWIASNP